MLESKGTQKIKPSTRDSQDTISASYKLRLSLFTENHNMRGATSILISFSDSVLTLFLYYTWKIKLFMIRQTLSKWEKQQENNDNNPPCLHKL